MNMRPAHHHAHTYSSVEAAHQHHTEESGSVQLLHRLKGKIAVRHLRSRMMPKPHNQNDAQPGLAENTRLDRYTSNIERPTFKTETAVQPEQKYRKAKMLPQLSLDVSFERKTAAEAPLQVPNRNNKMLDLIIDILKDNEKKEKSEPARLRMTNIQPGTPVHAPAPTIGKLNRFNTEPSVEYVSPQELPVRRKRTSLIAQCDFLKYSMSNTRKNLFSEHRPRHSVKVREDIKSSSNSRMHLVPESTHTNQWRSMDGDGSNAVGNIELMTFYPAGQKSHFADPLSNEFMDMGDLPSMWPKFSK